MEPTDLSVVELRELLQSRALTSLALVEQFIARTEVSSALNVYASFDAPGLRAQARQADARIAAGERLPLLGIPIALKDNIDAVGFPCGVGTGALRDGCPAQDSEVVRRLRDAGALIAGKLNMHELAFGITTNNRVTGPVRNPWDAMRIPGGSSGGSGAAVAARLVPAAIGTDTGGSVRVPAALCGVAGLRPTVGRVPGDGIAPISATRDTAGPLARTIRDCALIDQVLSSAHWALQTVSLSGLRLGVPRELFWDDLEPGVRRVAESALEALRAAGVELVNVDLAGAKEASDAAGFPIALYEFVRDMRHYLHETGRTVSFEQVVAGIGNPDVAAIAAPLISGGAVSDAAYQDALATRRRLQGIYASAFGRSGVEALVFPTTPLTASRIGEDETVRLNGRDCPTFPTFIRNTDPGSNAGIPGVSLPAGVSAGLPVGLALDAPAESDQRLLSIAVAIEAVLPRAPRAPMPF